MKKCPNFPMCRFCHDLAWSKEDSDFVCTNLEFSDWVEALKRRNSDEEVGAGTDHS